MGRLAMIVHKTPHIIPPETASEVHQYDGGDADA